MRSTQCMNFDGGCSAGCHCTHYVKEGGNYSKVTVKINFHAFLRNMCEKPLSLYCKSTHILSWYRILKVMQDRIPIVDVDGSYLYRKGQKCSPQLFHQLPIPCIPFTGWEPVDNTNYGEMAKKIPHVMPGQ